MDKSRAFGSGSGSATYEYHPLQKGNPWQPGFFRGAPWTGLGALLGALLSLTAGVLILEFSNNQPIADWMVQPTVYLAIASAAANVFLHFALSEAATIAWWYNSMKPRATLGSLHRNWTFNQSLLAALTSGRNFNIIALSSILVALVPINGPLFQRASHIAYKDFQQDIIVDIAIAEVIPDAYASYPSLISTSSDIFICRYTGYLSNRAHEPTLLTPAFSRVLSNFNQRSPIPLVNNSCKGHCNATVAGAGFVTNCSQSTHPFILDPDLVQDRDQSMQIAINGTDVFGSYMLWPLEAVAALDIEQDMDNWPYEIAGSFNFGLQFKNTTACQGNLVVRNCSFKPATVLYPITIDGNASTISLAAGTNISDDKVLKVVDGISAFEGNNNAASGLNASTYSGFFKALADSYQSVSHMSFGAIGYQIFVAGPLANRYLNITHDLNCDLNFRDPMDDVVADIRELMFRTALASANLTSVPTDLHHVPAQ